MKSEKEPLIVLFRQDLRINDNPALFFACQTGRPIIPVYILDDQNPGKWRMGGASRWWLHHSLDALKKQLKERGSTLHLFQGETIEVLSRLKQKYESAGVFWNRCYEPYAIRLEQKIKELFSIAESFNGSLLFEPWEILNGQHQPFKVFTPFWKRCTAIFESIEPFLPAPENILTKTIESEVLDSLNLLPKHPDWSSGLHETWNVGEKAAHQKLHEFINHSLNTYDNDRDIPSVNATSSLSPHLHFGEISPRQIFHLAKHLPTINKFLSEIGWREFSYYQLFHFPQLPEQSWRHEFSRFPWEVNQSFLKRWQKGNTGYPIVDAGMRQLWKTGWMHNRVRMIVASFLVKDLFIPWQEGANWFWDTLVDADLANNSASWQWVAGCGFDAAPFFRIFNPVLQSKKFDPEGVYIKRWIPELAQIPPTSIHMPWTVSKQLNLDYPQPIVDHEQSRKKALAAFRAL